MSDLKKILGYVGCAAAVIIMVAFAAIWIGFHRGETGGQGKTSSGSCSILFPASAGTDEQIGKVLNDYIDKYAPSNSDLKGKGLLIAQGARNQVNPALIVAIARKETSFGTAGSGISGGSHNSFGRTASSGQPNVGRWYKWSDPDGDGHLTGWDASLYGDDDESDYIKRKYIDNRLTTLDKVIAKYAPETENDTQTYIQQMTDWINEMARMGNGVVLGPECIEGALATGKWIWPVEGRITSKFGETGPSHPRPHTGLDIAAPRGTPIKAVDNGSVMVVNTNPKDITGIYVKIMHSNGLESIYGHMIEGSPTVSVGEDIKQGQIIGEVNSTGHSTGNHLHLGAKLNGKFVDPLNYLPNR